MAYNITLTNGEPLVTVADGTIDFNYTSLSLIGKNFSGYGEVLNENFVHLLENFSNSSEPNNPLVGQLWYDSGEKIIKLRTPFNSWKDLGARYAGDSAPLNPLPGDQWWDTSVFKLKSWNGAEWMSVGPVPSSPVPPNNPSDADLWWDSSTSQLKSWFEDDWIVVGPVPNDKLVDVSFNFVKVGRGGGNKNRNTMVGFMSLVNNTDGNGNTAIGYETLNLNTLGGNNTALGDSAYGIVLTEQKTLQ